MPAALFVVLGLGSLTGIFAMKEPKKNAVLASQSFTLVEVMIGSALLLLAFTALILAFMQIQKISVAAEYSLAAMHAARAEIEDLRSFAYTDIVSYTNIPLSGTILSGVGGMKHCSVTEPNEYKEIILSITWVNPGMSEQSMLSLATKISNTNPL